VKIVPRNGRVLVKAVEAPDQTKGGIYLPDSAEKRTNQGEVIAIAEDANEEIALGDRIIYREFGGTNVELEGEEYVLLDSDDVVVKFVASDEISD